MFLEFSKDTKVKVVENYKEILSSQENLMEYTNKIKELNGSLLIPNETEEEISLILEINDNDKLYVLFIANNYAEYQ